MSDMNETSSDKCLQDNEVREQLQVYPSKNPPHPEAV